MKKKLTPYLLFGTGVYVGSVFSSMVFLKLTEKMKVRMAKVETISSLVMDTDNWLWETINREEDSEGWVDELKSRLSYIEMVMAIYYMED